MKAICISAKAQHGKDTVANFMKECLEAKGKRVTRLFSGHVEPMINLSMQSTGARNMASNSTRSTKMFRKFLKHLGLKPERYTQTYMSMIEQLTWK